MFVFVCFLTFSYVFVHFLTFSYVSILQNRTNYVRIGTVFYSFVRFCTVSYDFLRLFFSIRDVCKSSSVRCNMFLCVFLLEVLASMVFTIVVLRYCIDNSRLYPFWTYWWAALSTISLRALSSLCYASNCNWNTFLDKHVHDNIKSLQSWKT